MQINKEQICFIWRFIWNQFKYDNIDYKAALLHHYHTFRRLTLQTKPDIADCFFVMFADQPPKYIFLFTKTYGSTN